MSVDLFITVCFSVYLVESDTACVGVAVVFCTCVEGVLVFSLG
jgi:hypothetical protein